MCEKVTFWAEFTMNTSLLSLKVKYDMVVQLTIHKISGINEVKEKDNGSFRTVRIL